MPNAKADLIEVCDLMVDALNAADLSVDFAPKREYLATIKLEELDNLRVVVIPVSHSSETGSRSTTRRDFEIHIGVQKKMTEVTNRGVDPLMLLVDEIQAFFEDAANRQLTLEDGTCANIVGFLNDDSDPAFSQEHLKEFRQFTSVLRAAVRVQ